MGRRNIVIRCEMYMVFSASGRNKNSLVLKRLHPVSSAPHLLGIYFSLVPHARAHALKKGCDDKLVSPLDCRLLAPRFAGRVAARQRRNGGQMYSAVESIKPFLWFSTRGFLRKGFTTPETSDQLPDPLVLFSPVLTFSSNLHNFFFLKHAFHGSLFISTTVSLMC